MPAGRRTESEADGEGGVRACMQVKAAFVERESGRLAGNMNCLAVGKKSCFHL